MGREILRLLHVYIWLVWLPFVDGEDVREGESTGMPEWACQSV